MLNELVQKSPEIFLKLFKIKDFKRAYQKSKISKCSLKQVERASQNANAFSSPAKTSLADPGGFWSQSLALLVILTAREAKLHPLLGIVH